MIHSSKEELTIIIFGMHLGQNLSLRSMLNLLQKSNLARKITELSFLYNVSVQTAVSLKIQ